MVVFIVRYICVPVALLELEGTSWLAFRTISLLLSILLVVWFSCGAFLNTSFLVSLVPLLLLLLQAHKHKRKLIMLKGKAFS